MNPAICLPPDAPRSRDLSGSILELTAPWRRFTRLRQSGRNRLCRGL